MKYTKKAGWIFVALMSAAVLFSGCKGDTDGEKEVESVSISPASLNLTADGDAESLTAVISPADAVAGNSFTWSVTPEGIVTLSSTTGIAVNVTPVAKGDATVTVVTGNGKQATCTVAVSIPDIDMAVVNQTRQAPAGTATEDNAQFIKLAGGKWTAAAGEEKTLCGDDAFAQDRGFTRATVLYVNQPMITAYTLRVKAAFPSDNTAGANQFFFGEFVAPGNSDVVLQVKDGSPTADQVPSHFGMGPAAAGAEVTSTAHGWRNVAGIRFGTPNAETGASGIINAYALLSDDVAAGSGQVSTLPGTYEAIPASNPRPRDYTGTYGENGSGIRDTAHTFELSWSPITGYTFRIYSGGSSTLMSLPWQQWSATNQGGDLLNSGTVNSITYEFSQLNGIFGQRTFEGEPCIYPGILMYGANALVISEVELIY